MELPTGKWKHIRKSMEWEAYNTNSAKGMVGEFSHDGPYLRWQSLDGQENMFMEVRDLVMNDKKLYVKHRSGLQYYFEYVEESHGTKKRKEITTKRSPGRRLPSGSDGKRSEKSLS